VSLHLHVLHDDEEKAINFILKHVTYIYIRYGVVDCGKNY